ncbi:hypothetical protein PYCCODRAFT_632097 [Trametes coccinea BRFM310]|uniref:Uncharacterized protein n=1 Tax=Trametes coccinea (strain BRFM310) TaxID=1353009 RepID=A0A1Y2J2K6_TRAC3|nr:hypothetical protein PYCCODRAFT_632097 [Trametes coccinea BRFM310]
MEARRFLLSWSIGYIRLVRWIHAEPPMDLSLLDHNHLRGAHQHFFTRSEPDTSQHRTASAAASPNTGRAVYIPRTMPRIRKEEGARPPSKHGVQSQWNAGHGRRRAVAHNIQSPTDRLIASRAPW